MSSSDGKTIYLANGKTCWIPTSENIVSGKRTRKKPVRYSDESFTAGSNNQYTAGREVDPYDREYDGTDDYWD